MSFKGAGEKERQMGAVRYRTCSKCGGTFREQGFRRNHSCVKYTKRKSERHPVCRICEITARTKVSHDNPALVKARNTLRHHAARFLEQGVITDKNELQTRYGWGAKQMAHDIDHAHKNGCPYCHRSFADMEHGLADVTLDIVDPEKAPFYRTNVRWVCRTCNTEKQRTPPEEWADYREYCDEWRDWQERRAKDEYAGLPLLEGTQNGQSRLL